MKFTPGMYKRLDKISLSNISNDASIITIVSVFEEDRYRTQTFVDAMIPGVEGTVKVWIRNEYWEKIVL